MVQARNDDDEVQDFFCFIRPVATNLTADNDS